MIRGVSGSEAWIIGEHLRLSHTPWQLACTGDALSAVRRNLQCT